MKLMNIRGHTLLNQNLDKPIVVFDCGANKGDFTKQVNTRFNATIWSLEPNEDVGGQIITGERITWIRAVLSGKDGEQLFSLAEDSEASRVIREDDVTAETIRVRAISLAKLFEIANVDFVDIVKLDIEGAEIEVIARTPMERLQQIGQITIEFHDFCGLTTQSQIDSALHRLRQAGFLVLRMTVHGHGDVLAVNSKVHRLSSLRRFYLLRLVRPAIMVIGYLRRKFRKLAGGARF